jgi:hypothetical protein
MAARARTPDVIKMMQIQGRPNIKEALLGDPHHYKAVRRTGDRPTLLNSLSGSANRGWTTTKDQFSTRRMRK